MSSTGSVSASTGLVSGTDYSTLISELMSVAEKPIDLIKDKISAYSVTLSAYSSLSSGLSSLETALDALTSSTDGFSSLTATSGNEDVVKVTATSKAVTGSYSVTVNQLATQQSLKSTEFTSSEAVGAGTLTLTVGSTSTAITVDSSDTLSDIASAINDAGAGVSAYVVNDGSGQVLMLKSTATGASNAFTISVSDSDGNNTDSSGLSRLSYTGGSSDQMTLVQSAQNASITVDGTTISSSSNTVSDAINGLTFTLKSKSTTATTVDVAADTDSIYSEISSFVSAYNAVVDYISTKQSYTQSTDTAGTLLGDSTVNRIKSTLKNLLKNEVSGLSLSDLGITLNDSGDLEIDSDTLSTALSDNFDGVKNLFANSSVGLAVAMTDSIDTWINSTDGSLTTKTDSIQDTIDRLEDRETEMQDRLDKQEETLTARFTALETLLSSLSTTASSVDSLISAMENLSTQISGG